MGPFGSYGVFPIDVWHIIIGYVEQVQLAQMLFVHPHFVRSVTHAFERKASRTEKDILALPASAKHLGTVRSNPSEKGSCTLFFLF